MRRSDYREEPPDRFINPHPEFETCPARTQFDKPCKKPAGYGTMHRGVGRCKWHGGLKEHYLAELVKDFVMTTYGDPLDIDPQEALLQEVQRTAGHVEWMRQLIGDFGEAAKSDDAKEERALAQYSPTLGMTPSVWLQIYHEERKHLVRAAEAAIRAGVSERRVKVVEEQARMLAMMFKSFMLDETIGMTPAQRIAAPAVIRKLMQADYLELEAQVAGSSIFDDEVIDAELVDDE